MEAMRQWRRWLRRPGLRRSGQGIGKPIAAAAERWRCGARYDRRARSDGEPNSGWSTGKAHSGEGGQETGNDGQETGNDGEGDTRGSAGSGEGDRCTGASSSQGSSTARSCASPSSGKGIPTARTCASPSSGKGSPTARTCSGTSACSSAGKGSPASGTSARANSGGGGATTANSGQAGGRTDTRSCPSRGPGRGCTWRGDDEGARIGVLDCGDTAIHIALSGGHRSAAKA